MRISDWSSDVCSSDLPHLGLLAVARLAGAGLALVAAPHHRRLALVLGQPEFLGLQRPDLVAQAARFLEFQIGGGRSEEHTSELQSLMRISYAVFCLKNKKPLKEKKHTSDASKQWRTL